jgi:hypothetical protein
MLGLRKSMKVASCADSEDGDVCAAFFIGKSAVCFSPVSALWQPTFEQDHHKMLG